MPLARVLQVGSGEACARRDVKRADRVAAADDRRDACRIQNDVVGDVDGIAEGNRAAKIKPHPTADTDGCAQTGFIR